jgi:hypothetical protein
LQLFRGNGAGGVELPPILTPAAALKDPLVMSTVDLDGDGDLDVWIGQYQAAFESGHTPTPFDGATNGPPTSLWRNLGNGRFEECLSTSGLDQARDRFVFSAVFLDTDGDHHPEFLQVSDFRGVDIGYNKLKDELFVIEVNSAPGIQGNNIDKYLEAIVQYV